MACWLMWVASWLMACCMALSMSVKPICDALLMLMMMVACVPVAVQASSRG